MDDEARRTRLDRGIDRLLAVGRRLSGYGHELVANPVRLLIGAIIVVLLAVALPLLIGGGTRLDRAWKEWRHERSVGRDWVRTTAEITDVRETDGLTLRLFFHDRSGGRHRAEVQVESTGAQWIQSRLPVRYNPHQPSQVDLVNVEQGTPLGSALVAGAAIGAGLASLLLAFVVWRRRRELAESKQPFTQMRVPLALAGLLLAMGLAAWAVGTVSLRGWSGVADRLGKQFSVVFGDLLGVTVPLVTFGIGCLLTAWLARHRHHEEHEGMLSNVHRLIDRAAGFVPSPEDLKAETPEGRPADADPISTDDEPPTTDASGSEPDGVIRTG